jgi:hypothetical protein
MVVCLSFLDSSLSPPFRSRSPGISPITPRYSSTLNLAVLPDSGPALRRTLAEFVDKSNTGDSPLLRAKLESLAKVAAKIHAQFYFLVIMYPRLSRKLTSESPDWSAHNRGRHTSLNDGTFPLEMAVGLEIIGRVQDGQNQLHQFSINVLLPCHVLDVLRDLRITSIARPVSAITSLRTAWLCGNIGTRRRSRN